MTIGQSQESASRIEDIRRWQIQTYDGDESIVPTANIAALYDGLITFLKTILTYTRKQRPEPSYLSSLEGSVTTLFFWGRDFGVSQGELDTALQFSNRLRDTVLTLLASLGDLLSLGLLQVVPRQEDRQAILLSSRTALLIENAKLLLVDPIQQPDYEGQTIERLCDSLRNMIESLIILGPSLEAIADDETDDEEARAWVELQDRAAHEYFVDLISLRFPSADHQLVQALGRSNWDRYNHVQRLRERITEQTGTEKARSEFHDSGVGSSAPAQQSDRQANLDYAATIISSRAETSHKRMPPLPAIARTGVPFRCEICSRSVLISRTKMWKQHVFEDICAYTCIYSDCSSARILFKDREAITNHLASHHRIIDDTTTIQNCPLCFEEISGGQDIVSLHFVRHMEEIALGVLPQDAESEDDSSTSNDEDEVKHPTDDATPSDTSHEPEPGRLPPGWISQWDNTSKKNYYMQISNGLSQWERPTSESSNLRDPEFEQQELDTIKCICAYTDDDGNTVLCEGCDTWQHIICYYDSASAVPEIHKCGDCNPRPLDSLRAIEKQQKQQNRMALMRKPKPARRASKQSSLGGIAGMSQQDHDSQTPRGPRDERKITHDALSRSPEDDQYINTEIRDDRSEEEVPDSPNARHVCPICHKAFSRASSLRIHSHSHSGEKPYACTQPGCGRAFSVRSNLKRHERWCHAWTTDDLEKKTEQTQTDPKPTVKVDQEPLRRKAEDSPTMSKPDSGPTTSTNAPGRYARYNGPILTIKTAPGTYPNNYPVSAGGTSNLPSKPQSTSPSAEPRIVSSERPLEQTLPESSSRDDDKDQLAHLDSKLDQVNESTQVEEIRPQRAILGQGGRLQIEIKPPSLNAERLERRARRSAAKGNALVLSPVHVPSDTKPDEDLNGRSTSYGVHTMSPTEPAVVSSPSIDALQSDASFRRVVCTHCDTTFTGEYARGNLQRHLKTSHAGLRFACHCGKTFARSDYLQNHRRKYHP